MTTNQILFLSAIPVLWFARLWFRAKRAARKRTMSAEYTRYINSDRWRKRRKRALKLAGGRCQHRGPFGRCKARHHLQCHHLTYARFGHEADADLKMLCVKHHSKIHSDRLLRHRPSYVNGRH